MIILPTHIRLYIEEHFAEPLCINALARDFSTSGSTLRRQFQQHYQMSVHKLIFKLRMERAATLLAEGKYIIAEVGRMVGYNDPSYFSQAFTKYHGKAPKQFNT